MARRFHHCISFGFMIFVRGFVNVDNVGSGCFGRAYRSKNSERSECKDFSSSESFTESKSASGIRMNPSCVRLF